MHVSALERRIEQLVTELAQYSGHRTMWLDTEGQIWHSEPEDELEQLGWVYITTLMRPTRDELAAALVDTVPLELPTPGVVAWEAPATAGIETVLVPAQV